MEFAVREVVEDQIREGIGHFVLPDGPLLETDAVQEVYHLDQRVILAGSALGFLQQGQQIVDCALRGHHQVLDQVRVLPAEFGDQLDGV